MKLVRVTHDRCDEYDGREFFLAPEDWSEDFIADLVAKVRKEMIADAELLKNGPEDIPRPATWAPFSAYPDKLVSEVLADWEADKEAYKNWSDRQKHLKRSFADRMKEEGFVSLWADEAGIFDVTCHWGHSHDLTLNYQHSEF